MITGVIIVTLIQGAIFHATFSFADGDDGTVRDTKVTEIPKARGVVTTAYNNDTLLELKNCLEDNGLMDDEIITFGETPGISYLFDIDPAISTVWPDLDSYSLGRFEADLGKLEASDEPAPTILVGNKLKEYANISAKYDMLLDYIDKHDYNKIFESDRFTVYTANDQ